MSKKLSAEEKAAKKDAATKEKAEKKAAAEAAKAAKKAARPKLVRKSAPFRKYATSPAGHFADSISALQRRLGEMGKKTARWGAPVAAAIAALSMPVEALRSVFEAMAAEGFKPKKGGAKRAPYAPGTFTVGTVVKLSAEALSYLQRDFSELTADHVVIVAHTYEEGDKSIPLCCFDTSKEMNQGQWLSRISYKWLTPVSAVEAPAIPSTGTDESESAAA